MVYANQKSIVNGSDTAPFIKAAIRDVKAYRDQKKYRTIPVGYSAGMLNDLHTSLNTNIDPLIKLGLLRADYLTL